MSYNYTKIQRLVIKRMGDLELEKEQNRYRDIRSMGTLQKEPFLNVRDHLGILDKIILSFDFQNLPNVQVNESVEHPRTPFWLSMVSTFPCLKVIACLTFNTAS